MGVCLDGSSIQVKIMHKECFHSPSVLFSHCSSKAVSVEMMGWMDWQANCLFFPSFPSQDPPQLGWINGWHCLSACNLTKMFSYNPDSRVLPYPAPRSPLKPSSKDTSQLLKRTHSSERLQSELYMCTWSIGTYCKCIYDLHMRWVLFIYWPVQLAEGSI